MKRDETTIDYSATLMPILKAIENIMYEILAKKYHPFIINVLKQKQIDKRDIRGFLKKIKNLLQKLIG